MFDIGFAELLIIGVVALLVIGPERLPGAIRTASAWVNRFRRSFNDIKQEVQQELHNDAVMRELREGRDAIQRESNALRQDLSLSLDPGTSQSDTSKAPEKASGQDAEAADASPLNEGPLNESPLNESPLSESPLNEPPPVPSVDDASGDSDAPSTEKQST